ncbi:MAG: efflux RND transporter permease subunit [Alphaproteobacteria bacterium]
MESSSSNNRGSITLRFKLGTDIDEALLRVSNKINEVASYPENVEKPIISATGEESSPVIWMMLKARDDNPREIGTYRTFFENDIRQYLERVDGVSDLFVFGGTEREMQVIVSAESLAAYNLTVDDVINALRRENADVSAGSLDVGRHEFRIRTVAEYRSPDDIEQVVLKSDGQRRLLVGDVAHAQFGYEKKSAAIINNGKSGIAVGIRPEPDANVLDLTDAVEAVVADLNAGKLNEQGIYLDWSSDQRPYIRGAINLLKQNITIGGILAVLVLLLFLRNLASTLVVATALPVSILGTFIFMRAMGSTLNVVSLAGIAFAVGMLLDNAIVVLENIDRHRLMGQRPRDAAYTGAREVWGAVLASTLTTIAVFLPVVFLEEEAGQLFRDIAIAVSGAVGISLLVSVLVIPMLSRQLFRWRLFHGGERKHAKAGRIARLGSGLSAGFMVLVRAVLANAFTRLATVSVLASGAVLLAYLLMPKMEYLPQGNRNLVINILVAPPGLSYQERLETGRYLFRKLEPNYGEGIPDPNGGKGTPGIKNIFYIGSDRFMLLGITATQEQRAGELIPVCRELLGTLPGIFGVSTQAGVFQQGLGRGRTIDVDFRGSDINGLAASAGAMFGMIMSGEGPLKGAQVRPKPSIELLFPEAQFIPLRDRLRAVGMDARQFGVALDVLMDGRDIGDFKQEGEKKINLVVKAPERDLDGPEDLYSAMVATPIGAVVPVSSLSEMIHTTGITQIRHLERDRTISLSITPPASITIQEAMEAIENDLLPGLKATGVLEGIDVSMSGTADKLTETREALQWNLLLAAVITYLLMSALFGNFIYPLLIMFTVPLAGAGGLLGLKLVNLLIAPQQLDVLTMLGFVILIGVVVNNPILIVHQALNNIRQGGMGHRQAVVEATRSRLRPIYMSATTSIFGMLPLVVWPGPGSELYRGLGSVVLGGLALSTVFTVFLIPSLLLFCIRMEKLPENDTDGVTPAGAEVTS